MRWPRSNSTSSPAASAGWTTTSGASSSATTCSGKPRTDSPVPSSQRARVTSRRASARRRWASCGASLASIACSAIPRLYRVEAPTAAAIPSTRSMSSPDHRTPAPRILGGLACATLAGYASPALAAPWPRLRPLLGIDDRTRDGRGYALTFDDGPHPHGTPAVLDVLAAAGVQATFFLVGEQVARERSLAGEIVAAGHTTALHCHRHRNLLRLTPWQVRDDLLRALALIEDATGRSPRSYRPPYGVLNAAALALARRRRWRPLLWSNWGRDWEPGATAASIAALCTTGAGEGSVLLLHDADHYSSTGSWRRTVAALPRIIDTLGDRGLSAVSA
jgi:peptidoglycan/xylan/chitin deacetylase (PgdA/CDA1 family)